MRILQNIENFFEDQFRKHMDAAAGKRKYRCRSKYKCIQAYQYFKRSKRRILTMTNPEKLTDDMMEQVSGGTLTKDEALKKALEHAHLKRDQVDYVKKVELDYEHGRKIYEVTFYKDGYEYEYDIDAESGKVLKFEKELDD
jgi:uncharacterized membrane protein YkoI